MVKFLGNDWWNFEVDASNCIVCLLDHGDMVTYCRVISWETQMQYFRFCGTHKNSTLNTTFWTHAPGDDFGVYLFAIKNLNVTVLLGWLIALLSFASKLHAILNHLFLEAIEPHLVYLMQVFSVSCDTTAIMLTLSLLNVACILTAIKKVKTNSVNIYYLLRYSFI